MAQPLALCVECQARPRWSAHRNTKYCAACQQQLLRAPRSRVTAAQEAQILALRGTMPRWQIAQRVGITQARLHRYLREQGLRSNARDYPPDVVATVCATYGALGLHRTQALFPDVVVRSIVERHQDYAPRQIRWTGAQQIEAIRMAGLVSHTAQARYFGRPNAYEGSIRSFWQKGVGCAPRDVHGLGHSQVWRLATPGVPAVLVTQQEQPGPRAVVLWLDLVRHLRPGVAPELRQMVEILARFQAWLFHGTTDTAPITRMIRERESMRQAASDAVRGEKEARKRPERDAYARDNDTHNDQRTPDARRGLADAGGAL